MPLDFSRRSSEAEIIDVPEQLTPGETRQLLHELTLVNRWLGGRSAVLDALAPLITRLAQVRPGAPIRLVDFGSGQADIPAALTGWARRKNIPVRITAVDFNFQVCLAAREFTAAIKDEVVVVNADVRRPPLRPGSCDIILFSAFLHHFEDREVASILAAAARQAGCALIWVDLHRHWIAYWAFRFLSFFLSRSRAIRHDGPLSIRKGFRRRELERILEEAGLAKTGIRWRWAFRYVVTVTWDGVSSPPSNLCYPVGP